ncbi:MAG: ABC transporter permease subunit [Leucobacter sp.]|nr:ABC transporter permease subunit [Leucobacter sp.]
MTTATPITSSLPTARSASPLHNSQPVRGRLTFDGVLRSEWIKLLSLRSIRWSILLMLLISWGGAALISFAVADTEFATAEAMPSLLAQSATFGSNITVLIMGVLGVLAATSEYSSGMILSSLAAVPRRTPMFAAKALVVAVLALLVGAVSTFGGGLIAAAIFGGTAFNTLADPAVLVSMLGTALFLMLATLLALGIGALLRSGAGAIAVVVVLLFVATLVFQILGITGWAWVPDFAQWLPSDLGYELSTSALLPADTPAEARGVGYWAALGGLTAWAAAALIPAAILFKTRDAM